MENETNNQFDRADIITRRSIGIGITAIILLGTVAIAVIALVMFWGNDREKGLAFIGQSLLPLWGTWIGTVLVFFFSRENFDAASKSYQAIINKLTPEEKMAKLNVKDVMLTVEKLVYLKYSEEKDKKIFDILKYEKFQNYKRYAVLDDDFKMLYMIHRSTFNAFISERILKEDSNGTIQNYTLDDLLNKASSQISRTLNLGFNFVNKDATLLDAKKAMDAIPECFDVFVTEHGRKDEPVLGMITNSKILEFAVV